MYRDHGVVVAIPRDGGKIVEIDDTGKQSTILEKDPSLPHPVKISMPGNSDTMVVADDMADQLVMSTIAGTKTKVYQKFDPSTARSRCRWPWPTTRTCVFSSDADPGVHKFMGDQSASGDKPVLPTSGGVAADHSSLRWAAAQAPNIIKVYEGQQFVKDLRLPPKKKFYKGGLMSFGPDGSLCVAVQDTTTSRRCLDPLLQRRQETRCHQLLQVDARRDAGLCGWHADALGSALAEFLQEHVLVSRCRTAPVS